MVLDWGARGWSLRKVCERICLCACCVVRVVRDGCVYVRASACECVRELHLHIDRNDWKTASSFFPFSSKMPAT